MRLKERYLRGLKFFVPSVVKLGPEWNVVGPGHLWMGCRARSFEDAIKHALEEKRVCG